MRDIKKCIDEDNWDANDWDFDCGDGDDCECFDKMEWGGPVWRWEGNPPNKIIKRTSKDAGLMHDPAMVYYFTLKQHIGKESLRPIERLFIRLWNAEMARERYG